MIGRVAHLLATKRTPLIFAGPLAFFATGCFQEAWTPAVSVEQGTSVPPDAVVTLPSYDSLCVQWALPPDSPWAPYQKMTLLSSLGGAGTYGVGALPDVRQLDVVHAAIATADHVASSLPERTAWIVDMRGAASVAFGSELRRVGAPVSCVLTFNNWPADDEMVPAEETLSALLAFAGGVPLAPPASSTPVFLLDAWRLAYRSDETPDDVMDNRYMLTSADLPDAASLRARGIDRIVYLVENKDDTAYEEDDLHEMFLAYQAAGIHLSIMDLDEVREIETEPNLRMAVEDDYVVEPRLTVVTDWRFYRRAHGGFGGIHGTPGGYGGGVALGAGFGYGGGHGFSFGHGGG